MKSRSFKKIFSVVLTLLLICLQLSGVTFFDMQTKVKAITNTVAQGTTYQWNNLIPEKRPAAGAKNNGKLVLFDNSHQNTSGQADWVLDGGFSDFADALVKEGYTVREYRGIDKDNDGAIRFFDDRNLKAEEEGTAVDKNEAIITYEAIKDADVFVTAESNRPMRVSEKAALKKFVDSGKGIYFIADHYNADRNCNTWDSDEVYDGYNRYDGSQYNIGGVYGDLRNPKDASKGWLTENFGLRYRFNAIDLKSGATGIKNENEAEGITKGVGPVLMAAGSTLAITNPNMAKGIVYFSNNDKPVKWGSAVDKGLYFGGEAEGAFVAISKPSAGRAAFIGDSSPIEDATAKYKNEKDGSTKSLHAGWTSAGNAAQLSINIVNWLADSTINYVGFGTNGHAKGIATPTPIAADELTDPDKGAPWTQPSIDPWNTDTYAAGSYGAPLGTTSGGGTNPPPSTGSPSLALCPIYVYGSEPFGAIIGGDITDPELGVYFKNGGNQVGAVKLGNTWSLGTSYTKLTGKTPIAITAKATKLPTDGQLGIRTRVAGNSSKADTRYATAIAAGYGFIEGKVIADEGDVAAVYDGEDVIGTAQVDADGKVKIAVKEGNGFNISIYGKDGIKKSDLPGEYSVVSGNSTPIIQKIDVISVSLNISIKTLQVGEVFNLTPKITPDNATNKNVIWSSDNELIAAVDDFGRIVALTPGEANITATTEDGNKTDVCKVTVLPLPKPVTGVSLDKSELKAAVGSSIKLTATINPENADNKNLIWTTNNPLVATVESGTVKINSEGTAVITVKTEDGDFTASCVINAFVAVTGIQLNKNTTIIKQNMSEALVATVLPTNATNMGVTWKSSNSAVADVDTNGKVTGKAAGTSTVTVTTEDGGFIASVIVTVEAAPVEVIPVTSVKLNKHSIVLSKNQVTTLVAAINPTNASIKDVVWSIGDSNIAQTSGSGNNITLSAKHWGITSITVKTVDRGYTDNCLIIVLPSISDLLNPTASSFLSLQIN